MHDHLDRQGALAAAERLLAERRARNQIFEKDADGFGEPAWDMLLMLIVGELSGRPATAASELLGAVAVPEVIGRPYLLWLGTRQLASLEDDRVRLTPRGLTMMLSYLEGLEPSDAEP